MIMAKRRKIVWQKLIDGTYPLEVELAVFQWMQKTGRPYEKWIGKWDRVGMDKCLFGYSANNHDSFACMNKYKLRLILGFVNSIVKTPNEVIEKWRSDYGIKLGSHKYLSLDIEDGKIFVEDIINRLLQYKGKPLKRDVFQSNFPERIAPYIQSISFSCNHRGYRVCVNFTYQNTQGSGWDRGIYQQEAETVGAFFERAYGEVDSWINKELI